SWVGTASARPKHARDPHDRAYHWPRGLGHTIREARRYGIQVALLVKSTPGWANGGRTQNWAPKHAGDYGNFLAAASRHYRRVRRWMIWGEPNFDGGANFKPLPAHSPVGPRRYALLLESAYRALKAVSRRNIVIGGMTYTAGDV